MLAAAESPAQEARAPTLETSIGVWYAPGAPETGDLWRPGDRGERLFLRGRVVDTTGAPVSGATVELWHADADGNVHPERYRARLATKRDGGFGVNTVLPGYVWGPRHVHFVVTHPDHRQLITRIFFKRDPEVGRTGHPELAVFLEDGSIEGEPALFAEIELILAGP